MQIDSETFINSEVIEFIIEKKDGEKINLKFNTNELKTLIINIEPREYRKSIYDDLSQ